MGIDQIARLAAEEARKEQNRADGGFGIATGRRPPLTSSSSKEKVSPSFAIYMLSFNFFVFFFFYC